MEPLKPIIEVVLATDPTQRHRPAARRFHCSYLNCSESFHLYRHYSHHVEVNHECMNCGKTFEELPSHICNEPVQVGGGQHLPDTLQLGKFSSKTFHRGALTEFSYAYVHIIESFQNAYDFVNEDLQKLLIQLIKIQRGLKASITLHTEMERISDGLRRNRKFLSPFIKYLHPAYVPKNIQTSLDYMEASLDLYTSEGSGWRVIKIEQIDLRTVTYQPPLSRGNGWLPTPTFFKKKSILNIKTRTGRCFCLSVLAQFYKHQISLPDKKACMYEELTYNQRRRLKRLHENPLSYNEILRRVQESGEIDFTDFMGEVEVSSLHLFEERNNIVVNVFKLTGKHIHPIKESEYEFKKKVDLLLLTNPNEPESSGHFVLIQNLSSLLSKANFAPAKICRICYAGFPTGLKQHQKRCQGRSKKTIKFPKPSHYKFKKLHMLMDIYFKIIFKLLQYTLPDSTIGVAAYGIVVLDPMGNLYFEQYYSGKEVMANFFDCLSTLKKSITASVKNTCVPMIITKELKEKYALSVTCPFCQIRFNESEDLRKRVYHHHHYIASPIREYDKIAIICKSCNYMIKKEPVVAISHWFGDSDANLILQSLPVDCLKTVKINFRGSNKILSFTIDGLRFMDSSEFMQADVGHLIDTLVTQNDDNTYLKALSQGFQVNVCSEGLWKKISFPDTSHVSLELLNGGFSKPDYFYNKQNEVPISQDDYDHAFYIYNHYNCNQMLDYATLYIKITLLQLSDVLLHFLDFALTNFRLSFLHSNSLPSYALDIALFNSNAEYEFLKDPEMLQWLEKGIIGALSFSNVRYAKSSCEDFGNFNGLDQDRSNIFEMDLNNIYGSICTMDMPIGSYSWISNEELQQIDFNNLTNDIGVGRIYEVDLSYDNELHDQHSELPMCLSKRVVSLNELSDVQQRMLKATYHDPNKPFKTERLSLDLYPKDRVVLYQPALKFYIENGLKVTNVYTGIKFSESPFLREFIEKLVDLRKKAIRSNDILINSLIKNCLVCLYGMFLSNTKNHVDIKACTSRTECIYYASRHNFHEVCVLNSHLSLFHMQKATVYYSAPILCAFKILAMSKLAVYKGYNLIKQKFPNSKLLAGETDSLTFQVWTPGNNFLQCLKDLESSFDYSNFPNNHFLYSKQNEGVHGIWKISELNIFEYISVRPRLFSYICFCKGCGTTFTTFCESCNVNSRGKKCASSLPKSVKKFLTHEFYRQLLKCDGVQEITVENGLTNYNSKLKLTAVDTRRYLLEDGINTIPLGHYNIRK